MIKVTAQDNKIKNRIKEYGFVKNQDYILVTENLVTKNRGGNRKPTIDYHITLDMVKEFQLRLL